MATSTGRTDRHKTGHTVPQSRFLRRRAFWSDRRCPPSIFGACPAVPCPARAESARTTRETEAKSQQLHTSRGAPVSRILRALDRAIEISKRGKHEELIDSAAKTASALGRQRDNRERILHTRTLPACDSCSSFPPPPLALPLFLANCPRTYRHHPEARAIWGFGRWGEFMRYCHNLFRFTA